MFKTDCSKNYLSSLSDQTERRVAVSLHCYNNFTKLNFVEIYYDFFFNDPVILFMIFILFYPFLFLNIKTVTQLYLAPDINRIIKKIKITPFLAAITMISISNGAPELISSYSTTRRNFGIFITFNSFICSFIFSVTIIISSVIKKANYELVLPRFILFKELFTYIIVLTITICFIFIRTIDLYFVLSSLIIYFLYLITSYFIEKKKKVKVLDTNINNDSTKKFSFESNKKILDFKENIYNSEDSLDSLENIITNIYKNIASTKKNFFIKLISTIFNGLFLFSIPSSQNPFMKKNFKFVILTLSIILNFEILNIINIAFYKISLIGIFFGIVYFILEKVHFKKNALEFTYYILGILSSISWIKIFVILLIDVNSFFSFYWNINDVIFSSIMISFAYSINSYYGILEIAKSGSLIIASIACLSTSIFTNLIGINMILIKSRYRMIYLNLIKEIKEINPIVYYFTIYLIFSVGIVLLYYLAYIFSPCYILNKKRFILNYTLYTIFLLGIFGFLLYTKIF